MTFGEKLHRLRREKGMSQEALAGKLGVSRQAVSRWELGEVVPDTANVLRVSRIFGVSTDYLLLDECDGEGDTPAVKTAEQNLKVRQMVVGAGFLCRVLLLSVIGLFHQYRLEPEPPVPMWWLLVVLLAVAVWKWRLDWRYLVRENGEVRSLLIPDLAAVACAFFLPFCLERVPGQWEILLGQLAAVGFLAKSVKTLRLHYGLPWNGAGKR